MWKNITISILTVYACVLSLYLLKEYQNGQEVVAKIDEDILINKSEIEENLKEYWNSTVSNTVDNKIIHLAAFEGQYLNPTDEELEKEAELSFRNKGTVLDYRNDTDKEYLSNKIAVKKLIVEHTLQDESLATYLEDEENLGENVYKVSMYTGDGKKFKEITRDLNEGRPLDEISTKYLANFEEQSFSSNELYFKELETLNEGEAVHIEEDDHHAVILINSIERKELGSLEENKEVLTEYYLADYFQSEKVNLINYLRSQHLIEVSNSNSAL